MAEQQQPQRPPPVPRMPAQRRAITNDDTVKAYATVDEWGIPVRKEAHSVENTFFKFDKERDGTGDDDADLIKRQAFNCCNMVGNKRREILPYLPVTNKYIGLVAKLTNELQGLDHKLRSKLLEFHEFAPGDRFDEPEHFKRLPALKKK